ncbi:hypothetical protein BDV96DRAFT_143098 [Lophiotrema nucula]|uniref:Uncharacterized protein n=1 Tax=Lophiotrema nucula TaxID=690887 RepID=A0A6A5ZU71_9PLEO|nr:hypothetical protein BDV96DRAFT_143098 [Lophiotrema nucula]
MLTATGSTSVQGGDRSCADAGIETSLVQSGTFDPLCDNPRYGRACAYCAFEMRGSIVASQRRSNLDRGPHPFPVIRLLLHGSILTKLYTWITVRKIRSRGNVGRMRRHAVQDHPRLSALRDRHSQCRNVLNGEEKFFAPDPGSAAKREMILALTMISDRHGSSGGAVARTVRHSNGSHTAQRMSLG